ncbi:heterokaryon incompatibility protein-domain-containing protein [Microdochium trichocladiopsis]|uniref:Heterokaryon incompatibility protein-domain-containing protein n=1 Tax=Microdochium trichocladiopsis TaxID=1682393 RepID=A0A9P9BMT9_9PEZI|nr:heterokaryon incompatibility protein-domain-containing protein [Microdochium trichocladiopsis]KAH7026620.1 heterokaryon incompatibility protein-domain-containing protein [Microdochium trichocladiopsis]
MSFLAIWIALVRNRAIWYWKRITSLVRTPLHLLLSPRYTYESVQKEDGTQIRLLHLSPGLGPLRMALKRVQLHDPQQARYEAISYAWGDSTLTESVYCDDRRLNIPASLYVALRQLRPADPGAAPRVLWADAICINQRDTDEKNHQVALMDQIYAKPTGVLIWLGADTEGLENVASAIEQMRSLLPAETYDAEELVEISQNYYSEMANLRTEGKIEQHFHTNDWATINKLLTRPWFDRKWIIQEVLMAPEDVPRTLISGDLELPWESLASLGYSMAAYGMTVSASGMSCLYGYPLTIGTFYADNARPLRSLFNAQIIKVIKRYLESGTLLDCIIATGLFASTDPRDQVYALLSLGSHNASFRADYHLKPAQVCLQFARSTLVEDQNLKCLGIAPHRNVTLPGVTVPDKRLPGLPSWVPDLTMPVHDDPLASYSIRAPLFRAGGDPRQPVHGYRVRVSDDGKVLHLRGRIVARIDDFATSLTRMPFPTDEDVAPKQGFVQRVRMRYRNWFWQCQALAFPVPPESPDGPPQDASSSVPAPPALQQDAEEQPKPPTWIPLTPAQSRQQAHYRSQPQSAKRSFALALLCGSVGMRDPVPLAVLDTFIEYMDFLTDLFTAPSTYVWRTEQPELRERLVRHGGLIEAALNGLSMGRKFCVATMMVPPGGGGGGAEAGASGDGKSEGNLSLSLTSSSSSTKTSSWTGDESREGGRQEGEEEEEVATADSARSGIRTRTSMRKWGMVRIGAEKGDVVCVVSGAEVPYVLRPVAAVDDTGEHRESRKPQRYTLVGDSYLADMMHGEVLEDSRFEEVEIDLV